MTIDQAEALRPVFAAADELGALLMIHPGQAPGEPPPAPFPDVSVYRASGLALQASLSQIGVTLIFSEILDTYRNLAIQLVNLGGTLPFILERLEAIASSRNPEAPFPNEKLRALYYDCASLGPRALELAVKVFGAGRIMLGTDYPIFRPDPVPDTVHRAQIEDAERQLVLRGTASAIISRLT
jgi:predicted TIM-barrel fold metal-dependent hydrolase